MRVKIRSRKQYLALWAFVCLAVTIIGILIPVRQFATLGLEGANQANLVSATEELTAGRVLEFRLELPQDPAGKIGFFFTVKNHEFSEGTLYLSGFAGNMPVGEQEYALEELTEDRFLFLPLDFEQLEQMPEEIVVKIFSDAEEEGPAVWLNENTVTPGSAVLNGEPLSKSLVYNLTYEVKVHQYKKPMFIGVILFLVGVGVYGAGGFVLRERQSRRKVRPDFCLVLPFRRQVIGLGAAVLAIAMIFFYLYDTQIRIAQNTTEKAVILEADGETLPVDEAHASVSQTVAPGQASLTGLGVRFYMQEGTVLTEGSMTASVTDLTLGQVLCETEVSAAQFISGEYVGLLFHDSQTGAENHSYRIDMEFSPELWDSGLELMTSQEGVCVNAYLYFNIFLKKFFFFLFLGVEIFTFLFWYLAFVKRIRMENLLFITLLFLGLVYNVMLTPQMVPDEEKHMDMAYRHSNTLLGYEGLGDEVCLMRADDAELEFTASPSFGNYRKIYYGLFSGVEDSSLVEAEIASNIEGSILLYLPAVLGMSAARLLGWGTVPMLLLARYLNLLAFALLARAGMKRLPFGQMTLFLLAVLPVNVQQCTSFSHDAMVHGILFYYSCLCLQAVFDEDWEASGQEIVLMELAALFLVYCKSGSYLPLCFLPVLIPAAGYAGKREKYLTTGALLGIPILAFIMKHMQMVTGIVNTTAATSVVSTGDGAEYLTGYTMGYFLKEPLEFIYMMANTLFDKTGFYLESLIGYQLGWVEIETSMLVVLLFWFLLFLSVCDMQGETIRIRRFQRFWMILLCLGCAGLILLGMLFQWTPVGHVSIEGVQGRYFLPFMPVLLAACRNQSVVLNRRLDREIALAAVTGQLFTLVCIIRQVTMV